MNDLMSLDSFIQEIEGRKRREIDSLDKALAEKRAKISAAKDAAIKQLQEQYAAESKAKSEREGARIVEESRLGAKKILFEAINSNLEVALGTIKENLKGYTQKPRYKETLLGMVEYSKKSLGGAGIVVRCRDEDRQVFSKQTGITLGPPIKT